MMGERLARWRSFVARPLPRNLLLLFLPWAVLISLLCALLYDRMLDDRLAPLLDDQMDSLGEGAAVLERHLSSLRGDLQFLSQQPLLSQAIRNSSPASFAALGQLFTEFANSRGLYQRIRWLDERGMEQVRINVSGGVATQASSADLYNDSSAYYFVEAMSLYRGDIYLSRFDLDRSYGEDGAVRSMVPVLRAAIPVFSERGERRGILVLDYRAERLLQRLNETSRAYGGALQLLDHEGYWMLSDSVEDAWGYLLGRPERSMANRHPSTWKQMLKEERGSFMDASGFWAYSHFRPGENGHAITAEADYWLLLSHLPKAEMQSLRAEVLWRMLVLLGVLQAIGLVVTVRLAVSEAGRMRAQHELQVSSRALQMSNERLTSTVDQLQRTRRALLQAEKLSSLGTLVAGVAHELNTPIGAASVAASTLERYSQDLHASLREGLKRSALDRFMQRNDEGLMIILTSLERMAHLTRAFKQLASDRASTERRIFDLGELVREVILLLQPKLKHSPHRVEVDMPQAVSLESYPGPLGQILQNLIDNALIHAFDPGVKGIVRVAITLDASLRHCLIEVSDDGRGMTPDVLEKIFDPFYTTRRGQGGTGLGLHITHQLAVDILGGELEVESAPGKGTRFTIRLDVS